MKNLNIYQRGKHVFHITEIPRYSSYSYTFVIYCRGIHSRPWGTVVLLLAFTAVSHLTVFILRMEHSYTHYDTGHIMTPEPAPVAELRP